jgi:K+-transporting ATPase c subunit
MNKLEPKEVLATLSDVAFISDVSKLQKSEDQIEKVADSEKEIWDVFIDMVTKSASSLDIHPTILVAATLSHCVHQIHGAHTEQGFMNILKDALDNCPGVITMEGTREEVKDQMRNMADAMEETQH